MWRLLETVGPRRVTNAESNKDFSISSSCFSMFDNLNLLCSHWWIVLLEQFNQLTVTVFVLLIKLDSGSRIFFFAISSANDDTNL